MKNCIFAICILTSFFVCGCRNHIKDIEKNMTDYERTLTSDLPILQVLEADTDNLYYRIRLTGNRESEVKVYQISNTTSRFTPWSGLRELYEVPMGLVLFPVSLCSHVVNIATLGIFPYSWCWSLDCFSLAALNPCLNIEDEERFKEEPLRSRKDLVDTRQESIVYPMRHANITLKMGKRSKYIMTDNIGTAHFDLLTADGSSIILNNHERELQLFAGTSPHPIYSWVVPRSIRNKVVKAAAAIREYKKGKPDGKKLYETVTYLEKFNFSKLSYALEKQELKKNNAAFGKAFFAEDFVK